MADIDYSIEEVKCIIAPIAEKYQISKVYLFGSYAKGDYREQSDIDLRIEKGEMKGLLALWETITMDVPALKAYCNRIAEENEKRKRSI